MNIFASISLLSFVISLALGLIILLRNPRALLNKLYFLFTISFAVYSLIEFGMRQAHTVEIAEFWYGLDVLFPFNPCLLVHIIFVFVGKQKWLKKHPWTFGLLYGMTVFFIMSQVLFGVITTGPVLQKWGYASVVSDGLMGSGFNLWLMLLVIGGLSLLIHFWWVTKDSQKKKQARLYILSQLFLPITHIVDTIVWHLGLNVVPMTIVGNIALQGTIAYAIWKYELFAVTPVTAAETIVTTMSDALFLVDGAGNIMTTNLSGEKMVGRRSGDLLGQPLKMLFAPNTPVPPFLLGSYDEQSIAKSELNDVVCTFGGPNNRMIPVSLSSSVLRHNNGSLMGFVIIVRDITERKRASDELVKQRLELEEHKTSLELVVKERTKDLLDIITQLEDEIRGRKSIEKANLHLEEQLVQAAKMEAIGRLAGGIAHDFNNLLLVISGYTDTIGEELPRDSVLLDDINEISKAANRAKELTAQLLTFSRKQEIKPRLLNLNEAIGDLKKMLSRLLGEDIGLVFKADAKVPLVKIDPGQFNQIILNLAVNARDAMPQGGTLTIGTKSVELSEKDLELRPQNAPGEYLQLRVEDTGHGISDDIKNMIFEPFFSTKNAEGTGFGLYTVYGIVEQNNGFIEVASTPNQGTVFQVYFPRKLKRDSVLPQVESDVLHWGTETILVVEDNPLVLGLTSRVLAARGYSVLKAKDADAALVQFGDRGENVNLVVTDVIMPETNGVKLISILKNKNPNLKVLYMSGYDKRITDKYGLTDYQGPFLKKPFQTNELTRMVRTILDG